MPIIMPDPVSTAVLDATDFLVFCATEETNLLYANPALLSVLGLPELPVGTSLISTISADYTSDLKTSFLVAKSSGTARLETVFNLQSRDTVHLEGSLRMGTFEGNDVFVGVLRDVTDRKRAEDVLSRQAADLMRASETLDQKDQEIAKALEQAKLYQQEHARAVELAKVNEDLEAEIRRRSEAEKTLLASLDEKEVLLKEIHHRVKNNMQVISSLLNLQMGELKDEQSRKLFEESQSRIRSMALVHEKLYESDDLASVNFTDYIDSLIRIIFRSYSSQAAHVNLTMDIDTLSLPLDQAIPCGLIVNELVCNALKYAFGSGRGRLHVSLKRVGDDCHLVVSDDGPGLPDDLEVSTATSLGLRLVNTLADQIDATVEVDTGEGTRFQVSFPHLS